MKNKLFTFLLTIGVTAAVTFIFTSTACNNKNDEKKSDAKSNVRQADSCSNIQVLYPASSAQQDIAGFQNLWNSLNSAGNLKTFNQIESFTVRAKDLIMAMGMDTSNLSSMLYDHVRVYLGYNQQNNAFKLFFVPVTGASICNDQPGNDVMIGSNGLPSPPPAGGYAPGLQGLNVLDLNKPCPSLCDRSSVLFDTLAASLESFKKN